MNAYTIEWHTKRTKYTREMAGLPFTVNAVSADQAEAKAIDAIYKTSGLLIGGVVIDKTTLTADGGAQKETPMT